MDADGIQRVTTALAELLTPVVGNVYVGPLDDADANGAQAVLFLYRVAINSDLRSAEHRVAAPAPDQAPIVHRGSLPLDLYYLLTAGTRDTGGELPSLRVLGRVMQALNDTPELVGVPVQGETVRLSLDPVSCEEMSRIWTLFPTANYRTSVVYLATPVWIDPARLPTLGGPVVHETYRVGHLQTSSVP